METELTAYLGMGGNMGNRVKLLRMAIAGLNLAAGVKLREISSFYETAPWGKTDQDSYINAAAKITFVGSPPELLACCQAIEQRLGRQRREKWGARTMDIDILHIEGVEQSDPALTLPHPYLTQRNFVLTPLAEIAPDLIIKGQTVRELKHICPDLGAVSYIAGSPRDFSLRLIACVQKDGGIGYKNRLLFDLPQDKAYFQKKTLGHTVIMGNNTRRSLPGGVPLSGRHNIVMSRSINRAAGFTVCPSETDLWEILAQLPSGRENYVIGGAEIYRLLMPYAAYIYLTEVDANALADAFFPFVTDSFLCLTAKSETDVTTGTRMIFRCYGRKTIQGDFGRGNIQK